MLYTDYKTLHESIRESPNMTSYRNLLRCNTILRLPKSSSEVVIIFDIKNMKTM